MGQSIDTDIVENLVMLGDEPKVLYEAYENGEIDDDSKVIINGWTKSGGASVGKRKRLYADKFKKGELIVYIVNTHIHSNGGAYDLALFSKERKAVVAFLKDFQIKSRITKTDSISQTC